jgi:hypothetical protein
MRVVTTTLTRQTNDKQQVEPILKELDALQEALGKPESLLADNCYFSKNNIQACIDHKIESLIALGREAHHLPLEQRLTPDSPEPESSDPLVKMAWKLKTQRGRALYGKRKSTVERCLASSNRCWAFVNSRYGDGNGRIETGYDGLQFKTDACVSGRIKGSNPESTLAGDNEDKIRPFPGMIRDYHLINRRLKPLKKSACRTRHRITKACPTDS